MKNEGHGGHWECLMELDYFVKEALPCLVKNGKLEDDEMVSAIFFDNETESTERLFSLSLDNNLSALALVASNLERQSNEFISGYPFVKKGEDLLLKLTQIQEWSNKFEAVLTVETGDGKEFSFFDTKYYKNKKKYEVGSFYDFTVSALAYNAHILEERSFSFEGEDAVNWLAKIGKEPELDAAGGVEPVVFDLSNLVAFFPDGECKEDAEFQSPVASIDTEEVFQNKFYVFRIFLFREPDVSLKLYARQSFFDKPPTIGEPLRGFLWLQGYLSEGGESASGAR